MRSRFSRVTSRPWFYRLNLQIHLWLGLLLTAYLSLAGLTGSILVFRAELAQLGRPKPFRPALPSGSYASIPVVLANLAAAYPGRRVLSISAPRPQLPFFTSTLRGLGPRLTVASHPASGQVLGPLPKDPAWLTFVQDLHVTLLSGRQGRVTNGAAAALLLLINATGLVLWWPGKKSWKRAMTVDLRRHWRRLNFDLHRAAGFWTLAISSMWALSGVYFGWPIQMSHWIDRLSPIRSAAPPIVPFRPSLDVKAAAPNLDSMIAQAYRLDPGGTLAGVNFPYSRRAPFEILMFRGHHTGREYTDTLYFNSSDGAPLLTWRYGINESLGDWLIWLQVPLHFGTFWGVGIKILWALCGLSLPLLAITGAVLYWNRILRHQHNPGDRPVRLRMKSHSNLARPG